jgi:hypothetical protein
MQCYWVTTVKQNFSVECYYFQNQSWESKGRHRHDRGKMTESTRVTELQAQPSLYGSKKFPFIRVAMNVKDIDA